MKQAFELATKKTMGPGVKVELSGAAVCGGLGIPQKVMPVEPDLLDKRSAPPGNVSGLSSMRAEAPCGTPRMRMSLPSSGEASIPRF